ncbi:MAG: ATP-binding protein [Candidatus Melainabacteria bacterium]|nr:ATP-binding protein [Candidatus Melainabacteria bacterium]
MKKLIGQIISGSFTKGLLLKLSSEYDIEDIRIGKFVTIEGEKTKYFSMVTDVCLETNNEKILSYIPPKEDAFVKEVLKGISVYGIVHLTPYLMVDLKNNITSDEPVPKVKTIPPHFSSVYEAEKEDIEQIFGKEEKLNKNFYIGYPAEMDIPICINLDKFAQRSNAVFGKSGTGKSFLSRILLSGILKKDIASLLIFDMHNEYGWQGTNEELIAAKGLKQLFNDKVEVFTLDPENKSYTFKDAIDLTISYNQVEIEDLELLRGELGLSEAAIDHARMIQREYERNWFSKICTMSIGEIEEFSQKNGANIGSILALQRKLNTLVDSVKYLKPVTSFDGLKKIISFLMSGKSVVLQFGRLNNLKSYILASNLITRQIHNAYVNLMEEYLLDRAKYQQPKRLVICIEEAHKFLSPQVSKFSTFGTIARELRKYNVTLLIIDQRPSGIDSEVLSQIGTRATLLLNDERDIEAVFVGESSGKALKDVLSQLNPKQEVLMFGYAMPMPIVIRTRRYDEKFYKEMSEDLKLTKEEIIKRGELAAAEL